MEKRLFKPLRGQRQDHNLITNGVYGPMLHSRRPLDYNNQHTPSVIGRPSNIRQIVSFWGRLRAAWLVFTTNAIAMRWYNEENAHTYEPDWFEQFTGPVMHDDYIRAQLTQKPSPENASDSVVRGAITGGVIRNG